MMGSFNSGQTQANQAEKNNSLLNWFTRLVAKLHHWLIFNESQAWNSQLYAEVTAIKPAEMSKFENDFHRFAKERQYEPEYEQQFFSHRYRIMLSIKWLDLILTSYKNGQTIVPLRGLELGEATVVTDFLTQAFPQVCWENPLGDLRHTWDYPDDSIDIIANMEVVEHISDIPDGINHAFFGTGLAAALSEAYRVMKPGGVMLVTTPNAASAYILDKVIAGEPPWLYSEHVHEFTIVEICTAIQKAGFHIQEAKAIHCLSIDKNIEYTVLFQALIGSPIYGNYRQLGDDLFIVAVKPT